MRPRHDIVAVGLAGNLIGDAPSTNAEKIVDKSVFGSHVVLVVRELRLTTIG
jgi:hypothetical protein